MQSLWIYGCWKHFGKHTLSKRGCERISSNVCEQVSDQSIWSVTLSLVHVLWIFRGVWSSCTRWQAQPGKLQRVHHTQETFCWTISSPLSLTVTRHNQRYHSSWQLRKKKIRQREELPAGCGHRRLGKWSRFWKGWSRRCGEEKG